MTARERAAFGLIEDFKFKEFNHQGEVAGHPDVSFGGHWGIYWRRRIRPVPQPRARRQAAIVVPVVMTLSTKYTGKGFMGPVVRMMACCSIVRRGRSLKRRVTLISPTRPMNTDTYAGKYQL